MKSFSDAQALVHYAKTRQLVEIEAPYREAADKPAIEPELLIATKHLLDSLRSALDYTAYGLFEVAVGPPKSSQRIYYPYAGTTQTEANFPKIVDKAMPGYRRVRSDVCDVISGFQHFRGAHFDWVPRFMTISNARKHHNLGEQLPFAVYGMQISTGQHQLVVQGLVIKKGGKFLIDGHEVPPGEYNHENLPPLPSGAVVEVARSSEVVFSDDTQVRVLPFLRRAVEGVDHIVNCLIPMA